VIFEKERAGASEKNDLEIYFETGDLDGMYRKAHELKIRIIHEIKTQPWQQRVFRFYDPDHFIIEIAETMDDVIKRLASDNLSIELIAEKTFMPKEAIQALLDKQTEKT
jgi:hypothetical protein